MYIFYSAYKKKFSPTLKRNIEKTVLIYRKFSEDTYRPTIKPSINGHSCISTTFEANKRLPLTDKTTSNLQISITTPIRPQNFGQHTSRGLIANFVNMFAEIYCCVDTPKKTNKQFSKRHTCDS